MTKVGRDKIRSFKMDIRYFQLKQQQLELQPLTTNIKMAINPIEFKLKIFKYQLNLDKQLVRQPVNLVSLRDHVIMRLEKSMKLAEIQ